MSHRLPICWEESLFHSKGQWNIKNQSLSITLRYLYWLAHSVSAFSHMRKDSNLTEPAKTKEWPFGFSVRKGKVSLWDSSGPLRSKGNLQKLGTCVYTLSPVERLGALPWFNEPSWKFNLIFFFCRFVLLKTTKKRLTTRRQMNLCITESAPEMSRVFFNAYMFYKVWETNTTVHKLRVSKFLLYLFSKDASHLSKVTVNKCIMSQRFRL